MEKLRIFLSHISEEEKLAGALKAFLEGKFLGMIDIFVSSNDKNNPLGGDWLEAIKRGLSGASIAIILSSPYSVGRPWVNFEAGACWIREIPVVPVCHSGMLTNTLPEQLKTRQAMIVGDKRGIKSLLRLIASKIGANEPSDDGIDDFISEVGALERKYTFWDEVNVKFRELNELTSGVVDILRHQESYEYALLKERADAGEVLITEYFAPNNLIAYEKMGMSLMGDMKWYITCKYTKLDGFHRIVDDPNFHL